MTKKQIKNDMDTFTTKKGAELNEINSNIDKMEQLLSKKDQKKFDSIASAAPNINKGNSIFATKNSSEYISQTAELNDLNSQIAKLQRALSGNLSAPRPGNVNSATLSTSMMNGRTGVFGMGRDNTGLFRKKTTKEIVLNWTWYIVGGAVFTSAVLVLFDLLGIVKTFN